MIIIIIIEGNFHVKYVCGNIGRVYCHRPVSPEWLIYDFRRCMNYNVNKQYSSENGHYYIYVL